MFDRVCAFLIVTPVCLPGVLAGQSTGVVAEPPPKRFSLALELGASVGGPGAGLVDQLRRAGYVDTRPRGCILGFCSGPTAHPSRTDTGPSVGLTVRYDVTPGFAVGAGSTRAEVGGAHGYRAGDERHFGELVFSDWEAAILWGVGYWTPRQAIRLGLGPGWYRLTRSPDELVVTRVGVVGEVTLEGRANRSLFPVLSLRVHHVPSTDVGHGPGGALVLRTGWSHVSLLAGGGIRF